MTRVTSSNPMIELAALMVETDFVRGEMDDQNLRDAREAQRRAMAEEVHAMHEAADAIATRAWVQGSITVAAGAAQCAGSLGQIGDTSESPKTGWGALDRGGDGLGRVAEPAGDLLGGVPKAEADADAARARNESAQAGSRADEAAQHRDRLEKHTDRVLELIESTLESEHQGSLAVLGNF
jgi:hypothetical protein